MRILLLLLLTQLSFGQIKGIVKDPRTGLPIPYVNIGIENKTLGFSADENGMFFYAKSDENQNLIFTAVGYKSFKINSENLPKEILLTENILVLPDLEVSPPKH
ncbi:MAG: carboxypeptidase-like regulatory domain-containing protein [Bacteroidetes bacterium]|nr:carboxypeptidase-like regulatory domain-containing protein [Bacteroidota bacterium]